MVDADATLRAAERVVGVLESHGISAVVIGAVAMAAYRYVRFLVALKLYAGGSKSRSDIIELLRRNPDADLGKIKEACRRYRLRGLGVLLRELER